MKNLLILLLALLPLAGFSSGPDLPQLNYFGTYDLPGLTRTYIFGRAGLWMDSSQVLSGKAVYPPVRLESSGRFLLHKDLRGRIPRGEVIFQISLSVYEGGYSAAVTNLTFVDEERRVSLEEEAPEGIRPDRWEVARLQADERIRRMLLDLKDFVEDIPVYELEPVSIDEQRGIHLNAWKPVIYLYPEEEREISVKLEFEGKLDFTWPLYKEGWRVKGSPEGKLRDLSDGTIHQYLFWEGPFADGNWDLSEGYCVAGEEVLDFFREKLPQMELQGQEINDFITYWAPQLQQNAWNLLTFPQDQYEERARLRVEPRPESVIRVFMVAQPLEAPVEIREPEVTEVRRTGFTMVEWGGGVLPRPGI